MTIFLGVSGLHCFIFQYDRTLDFDEVESGSSATLEDPAVDITTTTVPLPNSIETITKTSSDITAASASIKVLEICVKLLEVSCLQSHH